MKSDDAVEEGRSDLGSRVRETEGNEVRVLGEAVDDRDDDELAVEFG